MAGSVPSALPEQVVVLETAAPVDELLRAIKRIEGIEWLAAVDEPDMPPDDDFFDEKKPEKALHGALYLTFVNQQAMDELLSLWERWKKGGKLDRGFGPFAKLFQHLRDVRRWSAKDRLESTGVLADWRERVAAGEEMLRCEIELWYRRDDDRRALAGQEVRSRVEAAGGVVLQHFTLDAILYDALLVELPITEIEEILQSKPTALVQCEDVRLFGAVGQMMAPPAPEQAATESDEGAPEKPATGLREPVAALLDGMPLQQHARLAGRLVIDDPDGWEADYPAKARVHGTAMASLIVHGDLRAAEAPLDRSLYVRPLMRSQITFRGPEEAVPEDVLLVDLVHRAVLRMVKGEGDEPAAAPGVRVVNLSLGDRDRPFDRLMSPLARLLDYLASEHELLFVVSAGNYPKTIELQHAGPLSTIPPDELQALTLRAVATDTKQRRLLSPAEGLNVLTVGASHRDASGPENPPGWVDPYSAAGMPSPINGQGLGFRRCIKPDVLMAGGRVVLRKDEKAAGAAAGLPVETFGYVRPPGVQVAAPGATPGELDRACYDRGSSIAAALTTRAAVQLVDVLDDLRSQPGGDVIGTVPHALWLRAMLVHGAHWSCGAAVAGVLCTKENKRTYREQVARLLGYGEIDPGRLGASTDYRVTALGGGALTKDTANEHRFPLPPALAGKTGWRRLTITLAYFTPINPSHQNWRRAHLWFDPPKEPLAIERMEGNDKAVRRGTLQHEILEGDKAAVFLDGDALVIRVNCRADAGALGDSVPYALAITLEVAESIGVAIYNEIEQRIRPKVPVMP